MTARYACSPRDGWGPRKIIAMPFLSTFRSHAHPFAQRIGEGNETVTVEGETENREEGETIGRGKFSRINRTG